MVRVVSCTYFLMDFVTLTIDGRQLSVPKGTSVLQAAIEAGIQVPYYCYHPGLGIDGVVPRLPGEDREDAEAADVVLDAGAPRAWWCTRRTPRSSKARKGVFEFLLINHPLDCPVCDKGGECPLQDFSLRVRQRREPHGLPAPHVRRRGREGRRRLRPDADAQPQPLHPVHALQSASCAEVDGDAQIGIDRPRQRQRDRDVQRAGRALAALGQPDGRVPGRRDHDARLSVPARARGTTRTRSTPSARCARRAAARRAWLKAKPEWAKGARLVAHHAALQPGRSTTTGCATSAASSTCGSKASSGCASRCSTPRTASSRS